MSAQRTKKRFGSRRRVDNQNEMPKTDKILVTDNSNTAQHYIPEENIEPSCVLSNHDNMPSPELKANRRKLGSRRKNKEQHEKDLATELSEKPEEEVSKNSQVNEALETQLAIQSERQEESGESHEHEMSVTSDNSYSTITSAYCGIQNYIINIPEDISQILHPKSENLQVEQDEDESDFKVMSSGNFVEPMLEQGNKSDSIQRELVKDNALLIGSSERVLSSQLGVSCVTETEKKKWNEDADLLQQEGNISTIVETTTDKSNTTQNSTDTAMASPKDELSADDKQNEQFSLPLGSQTQDHSCSTEEHNDANVNTTVNRRKLGSSRKNKRQKHIEDSVADPYHETKEDIVTKVSGYGDLEATKMTSLETAVQVQPVEMTEGMDKPDTYQTETLICELKENTHTPTINQQLTKQPIVSRIPHEIYSLPSVTDAGSEESDLFRHWGVLQAGNLVESTLTLAISTEKSNPRQDTEYEHSVEQESSKHEMSTNKEDERLSISEVRRAQDVYNAVKKAHEEDFKPTATQEISDSYQSELKSNGDYAAKQGLSNLDQKQDGYLTQDNNVEALDQIHGDSHVYDPKKTQTSDIERVDNAVGQVRTGENEGWLENEIKSIVEQSSEHQEEGLLSEPIKNKTLQTLQSETHSPSESQPHDNSVITDKQDSTDFNLNVNSGELESIHVNEGEQNVNSFGAESKMSLMMETVVQEMSVEVLLKGNERFVPVYTGGFSDQAKENTQVSTSELNSTSVDSSPPVDQQAIKQSKEEEDRPQEVSSMHSVTDTETEEGDKDNDLLRQWGNLQSNNLVNETHFKSENVESSIIPEITTEESNHEHTEPESRVEQATVSSAIDEMSATDEQNVSDVRGALDSKDAVTKVHHEEVKPAEMHLVDYSTDKASISLQSEIEPSFDFQPNDSSLNIKEKIHIGFKPAGNRRKLGSSRRHKERQHVPDSVTEPYSNFEEEIVQTIQGDDISEKEKMPSATETIRQDILKEQIGPDFNPTEKMRKNRSNKRDKENAEQMPKEDTTLDLHNSMDSSITVSTESDYLKLTEQINEVEKKLIREPKDLSPPTDHDTIKTDLIQSAEASDLKHCDDNDSNKSVTSDVLDQKEAIQEEEEMNVKLTKCTKETVGATMLQVELNGECKDNTSNKVTHGEPFSAAQNENVTCALVDTGREENSRPKPTVNMSEESDISGIPSASNNQQGILPKPPFHGNVQETRRKMGSTRRTQLNRKQMYNKDETKVNNLDVESDVINSERIEVVEELSLILTTDVSQKGNTHPSLSNVSEEQQEIHENNSVYDERQKPQNCTPHPQARECNMIPGVDDSTALTPEQSTFLSEEVVHPVRFVQGSDEKDSEEKEEECINVTQGSSSKVKEAPAVGLADMETMKCVVRRGVGEQLQNAHVSVQESNSVTEEGQYTNFETMNANFSPANRRRKMGSTRRNLRSRSKEKDLHQNQEVEKDITETSVSEVIEKELQLQDEKTHSDFEQKKEKVFETVECSHTGESHMKPPALQMVEENPGSPSRPAETEHHLTPDHLPAKPCTSPKHDVMSESATGGRRRKMGSHRKSHRHQNAKDQTVGEDGTIDAQRGGDITGLTDESEEHREESLGLDRSSEVDKNDKKLQSNISGTAEHSQILSEKAPRRVTPVHHPNAHLNLNQEIQSKFSLGVSSEANVRSKVYNVLLVGESSVGKTSFMKRAQSGKFSLDLPASIGLDSCRWTVVVDGKPVVLQLWDTAGQERFRSITRQVFHKAQAFLLMYDITSSQSFSAISYWANCIQEGAAENVTILLIGNKSDCAQRRIKTEEGEILSKEYNFEFMECSAATGENVIQILETVARMLKQKVDTREEAMAIHKEPPLKKRSGCC